MNARETNPSTTPDCEPQTGWLTTVKGLRLIRLSLLSTTLGGALLAMTLVSRVGGWLKMTFVSHVEGWLMVSALCFVSGHVLWIGATIQCRRIPQPAAAGRYAVASTLLRLIPLYNSIIWIVNGWSVQNFEIISTLCLLGTMVMMLKYFRMTANAISQPSSANGAIGWGCTVLAFACVLPITGLSLALTGPPAIYIFSFFASLAAAGGLLSVALYDKMARDLRTKIHRLILTSSGE